MASEIVHDGNAARVNQQCQICFERDDALGKQRFGRSTHK